MYWCRDAVIIELDVISFHDTIKILSYDFILKYLKFIPYKGSLYSDCKAHRSQYIYGIPTRWKLEFSPTSYGREMSLMAKIR